MGFFCFFYIIKKHHQNTTILNQRPAVLTQEARSPQETGRVLSTSSTPGAAHWAIKMLHTWAELQRTGGEKGQIAQAHTAGSGTVWMWLTVLTPDLAKFTTSSDGICLLLKKKKKQRGKHPEISFSFLDGRLLRRLKWQMSPAAGQLLLIINSVSHFVTRNNVWLLSGLCLWAAVSALPKIAEEVQEASLCHTALHSQVDLVFM